MNKLPAFQFYPGDWLGNVKLRRCSHAARGAWMDILCVLHDADEYGVVRWPLKDLAQAAGVPMKLINELVQKDVLKGSDSGCEAFIYTPRSGRQNGESVVLIEKSDCPIWFCSRFVRDSYVRKSRGEGTKFGNDNGSPKHSPKHSPKPPFGEAIKSTLKGGKSDGSSSSSSSSSSNTLSPGVVSKYWGNPAFAEVWGRWKQLRFGKTGQAIDPIQEQSMIVEVERLSLDEAIAAMEFTILRNALNPITNGDHKRNRAASKADHAQAPSVKPRKQVSIFDNIEQLRYKRREDREYFDRIMGKLLIDDPAKHQEIMERLGDGKISRPAM